MSADRILALKLITDVGNVDKQMRGVQGRMKGLASDAKSWGKALGGSLVIGGIEKVGGALMDAAEGFKSGRLLADQLGVTWKNLGLNAGELDGVLKQVTDSTLALGTSDDEAVKVFTQSLQRTHDYHDSLRRLTIAQDLVANGSAPDLASAMKIVDGAGKGTAKTVDKFGLKSHTASGRIAELGRKVKGAAKRAAELNPQLIGDNSLGEALGAISGSTVVPLMDALGVAMKDTVAPAVTALSEAIGQNDAAGLAARIAAVAVAAGVLAVVLWANPVLLVAAGVTALAIAIGALFVWWDKWPGKAVAVNVATASVGAAFDNILTFIRDTAMPYLTPVFEVLNGFWTIGQGLITGNTQSFIDGIVSIAKGAIDSVLAPFQVMWALIRTGFHIVGIDIASAVGGAFDTIVSNARGLINGLIDILNGLLRMLGQPEWEHVGTGLYHPGGTRPKGSGRGTGFASGTDSAPGGWGWVGERGPELMRIPRGSQIVPHRQSMAAMGGGNTYHITLNVPPTADKAAVGREVVSAITAYEKRAGKVWRSR